jgi:hypothetical protein
MSVFFGIRAEVPSIHLVPADLKSIEVFDPCNFRNRLSHGARRPQLFYFFLFAERGQGRWLVDGLGHAEVEGLDFSLPVNVHLSLSINVISFRVLPFRVLPFRVLFFLFLFLLFIVVMERFAFQ